MSQDYDNFEVIIIEQSDTAQWEEFGETLNSLDDKVRIVRTEPWSSAAAKNLGVLVSRGDVVLLMDDDDLPIGNDWISSHAMHYEDPLCVGVSGRCVKRINEQIPEKKKQRAYTRCLTYSFFVRGRDFTGIDKVKKPVEWLHALNASVRRSYVLKLGGWYPYVQNAEEHSFCFKLQKAMRPGEYLMFDPRPLVLRRFDIPGGLGKRFLPLTTLLTNQLRYYHRVVSEYFPLRFYGLYPLFMIYSFQYTTRWFRIHSYYEDSFWIQRLGKERGQRLYILQEFLRFPFLVFRTLLEKKPTWRGELTIPEKS